LCGGDERPRRFGLFLFDPAFQKRENVLKLAAVALVGCHEVFVRLKDETRVFELRAVFALKLRSSSNVEIHLEGTGIHRDEAVKSEVSNEFEIPLAGADDHQASRGAEFAQLQGGAGHDSQESAVHARAILEVQDELGLPLADHLREEVVQTAAILKRSTAFDPDEDRIGVSVD
jgi:hypothetical protein